MKYILLVLLSFTAIMAQNRTQPAKLLVGGNNNVSMGQVVAGYSNDYHVGIRIPYRTNVVSVNEEVNNFCKPLYPNPCQGKTTFADNVVSVEVVDLFGNRMEDAVDYETKTINVNRGTYFVSMINTFGRKQSTLLISQ